ncbi:unnamed protein product [Meloidogyne enterolobii]|uniref:Uncharacterized protein n=1 Tax=Meloidogyne enterolobii TaxID=390850 RepID=A0ACB0Z2Y0_MELEN
MIYILSFIVGTYSKKIFFSSFLSFNFSNYFLLIFHLIFILFYSHNFSQIYFFNFKIGDTNRPLDLTDENDSLMDPPPTENVSNKLLPVHYSLRFVWQILQKALHCVKNGHENILETATKFWGDSLRKVYSFLTTSVPAQQLFCRILVRRRGFHIARNIRYHDLGPKLMPLFIELCENGFFEEAFSINENGDPNSSNITLDEAFNLLQVDDFKIICKKFHIDTRIGRQGIIRELKKHAIRRDVFGRCNLKHLLNCIKQLTGKCYRIKQDVLYFFNSFFSVYAPNLMDVGAAAVRPHQCYVDLCDSLIFSMLQRQAETLNFVNNLNLKYSLIDLFSDFDGLTRYVKAKYDEQRLVCFIDKIFQFINLPVYLRKFTPPWIYCRCIFRGVEAAQRLRDYELAVNWLIFLLSKEELKHFCINSRGRWYKRLVLNLNKHLKRNEEAAKFCCKGIEENFVLISDKLSLQERLDKLSQRVVDCPQALLENRLVLDEPERVSITGLTLGKGLGDGLQVNHFYIPSTSTQPNLNENVQPETIQSDTLSSSSDTSSCSSFASTRRGGSSEHQQPSTQTTTAPTNNTNINKCNVEEIALRHFIENENYKEGVHAEGKIWHMLFRLFFWDIISCVEFENELANNVWISWMQNDPLDLNYTMFYENRLTLIDSRLEKILESLSECILLNKTPSTTFEERISSSTGSPQRKSPRKSVHCPCFIHSTVEKHYNEKLSKTMGNSARSSTIEWHDFEGGKEQLFRFLHCCSPVLLHALFKKLCSNFRQSRSGFPDLTLWNAEDRKLAVVEVKGPNDKLSTKQQIWLDFFKSQGVRAVVCHVSAKNDRSIE